MPETTLLEDAQASYDSWADDLAKQLDIAEGQTVEDDEGNTVYYSDEARDEVTEGLNDVLDVTRYATYWTEEETEWHVLLSTGGPATRVVVRTNSPNGDVISARYQYQHWFQPWTDAPEQDSALVERFANFVYYYGEDE